MGKYDDMEYRELQAEASARDLPATGSSDDLIERLEEDDAQAGQAGSGASDDGDQGGAPAVAEQAAVDALEDDDGFVGVSPDHRHRPASVHYSPNPGGYGGSSDSDDED